MMRLNKKVIMLTALLIVLPKVNLDFFRKAYKVV